jgi:hypothetical protein
MFRAGGGDCISKPKEISFQGDEEERRKKHKSQEVCVCVCVRKPKYSSVGISPGLPRNRRLFMKEVMTLVPFSMLGGGGMGWYM